MNELISASDQPPPWAQLARPQLALFYYETDAPTGSLLRAAVHWAARGQAVRVLDGANDFDGYFVARMAYRLSPDPSATLGRIRLSRAFTCFQLAQRIETLPATPAGQQSPLVVLGFLSTFYDESVPLPEAQRLLDQTLIRLHALAACSPVIVSTREPRALVKDRWVLLERLQLAADAVWAEDRRLMPAPTQLPLMAADG